MKILFVVGKLTDFFPHKYTSKKCPLWLKNNYTRFKDYVDLEERKVPSDVAMAVYLYDKYGTSTYCILGDDVRSPKDLDPFDVVFVINDPSEVEAPLVLLNAMSRTSAFVYPYPDYQMMISHKFKYYEHLKNAGIQLAPFFYTTVTAIKKQPQAFQQKVIFNQWKGAIIKPSFGGYAAGIKVYRDIKRTTMAQIKKDMQELSKSFLYLTVAEFIPSFGRHYEIRTYWINGTYAYSVATLTKKIQNRKANYLDVDNVTTFKSEGGKLSDNIKLALIRLGKSVIKAIPQYEYGQPFMRIDFGCCMKTSDSCPATYFVNEVETLAANMLPESTKYPVVQETAEALYQFAKKVNGKRNNPKYTEPPSAIQLKRMKRSCVPST